MSLTLLIGTIVIAAVALVLVLVLGGRDRSEKKAAPTPPTPQAVRALSANGGWLATNLDPPRVLEAIRGSGVPVASAQGSQTIFQISVDGELVVEVLPGAPTRLGFGVSENMRFATTGAIDEDVESGVDKVVAAITAAGGTYWPL